MNSRVPAVFVLGWVIAVPACSVRSDAEDPPDPRQTAWLGVWHLSMEQETGGSADLHLSIDELSEGHVNILTANGRPHWRVSFGYREPELRFGIAYSDRYAIPYGFVLQRQQDRMTGTWSLSHPQFQMGGAASAFKVFDRTPWEPFKAILEGRQDGPVDATTRITQVARTSEWASFLDFWETEYLPDFYIIGCDWLHGGDTPPEDLVARLYADLPGHDATAVVRNGSRILAAVDALVPAGSQPAYLVVAPVTARPIRVVSLWTGPKHPLEDTACCTEKAALPSRDETYVVVNPIFWSAESPFSELLLAKELIGARLWGAEIPEAGIKLARDGVSLVLAGRIAGMSPGGSTVLPRLRAQLLADLHEPWDQVGPTYVPDLLDPASPGYQLASAIGEKLLAKYSLEEIRQLDPSRIFDEWDVWLSR